MKVIYNSNESSNNSIENIISIDALLHRVDSGLNSKIELVIMKLDGIIERKDIFKTKNKVDNFMFFTLEEKDNFSVYFLICLDKYEKVLFFSLNLSKLNFNDLTEVSLQDNFTISILDIDHIHFNHNPFNKHKQEPVDDAKINFIHNYLDKNNDKIFVLSGLIFPYWFTLIKIKIKQNLSKKNIDGNLHLKNFRYAGFAIFKIFYNSLERDFTGDNYELILANFYDNKSLVNFQKILVPNLESELIMNYDFLSIKLDDIGNMRKIFKFSKLNDKLEIFYLFYHYGNYFRVVFFDGKNISILSELTLNGNEIISDGSRSKDKNIEDTFVDYFKIIENQSKNLFFMFLITNNQTLKIFEISSNYSNFKKLSEIPLKNTDSKIKHTIFSKFKLFQKKNCLFLSYFISLNDLVSVNKINIEAEKLELFTEYYLNTNTNINILPISKQFFPIQIILDEIILYNLETSKNIPTIIEEKLIVKNYNNHYNEIFKSYCELKDSDYNFDLECEAGYELISVLSGGFVLIELKNQLLLYDYFNHKIKINFFTDKKLNFEYGKDFLDVYEKVLSNKILLITRRCFVVYDWKKDVIEWEEKFEEKDEMLFSIRNENENLLYFVFKDKIEIYSFKSLKKMSFKLCNNHALFSDDTFRAKYKNLILVFHKNVIEFFCFENSSVKITSIDFNDKLENNIERIFLSERNFFILACNYLYVYEYKINEGCNFSPKNIIEFPKCYFINYQLEILRSPENKNLEIINFVFIEKKEKMIKKLICIDIDGKCKLKDQLTLICNDINYKISKNSDFIYSSTKQKGDHAHKIKIWKSLSSSYSISNHSLYSFNSKGLVNKIKSIKNKIKPDTYLIGFSLTDKKLTLTNKLEFKTFSNDSSKISDLIQIEFDKDTKIQDYDFYINPLDEHIIVFVLCKITKISKISNNLVFLKFEKLSSVNKKCLFLDKSMEDFSINEINDFQIDIIRDSKETNSEYILTKQKYLELDIGKFFTNIQILKEINTIILNSNYGNLKFLQIDEFCNSQVLYDCSYSSHLVEISSLKSQYDNKEDLGNLFTLDESMRFIDNYELFDSLLIDSEGITPMHHCMNVNLDEEVIDSINNNFIMLLYNFGIIVYNIQIDNLTNYSQLSFYQQISFDYKIHYAKTKFIRFTNDFLILLQTEKEVFNIRYRNNKFICHL